MTDAEIDLARNSAAFFDGSASSDADLDPLTFTWTQTGGADITGGAGFITGATPAFTSPQDVGTLFFNLVVNDGTEDSNIISIRVNVLEHLGLSFYVDADNGDDTLGDGSRTNPYATISHAINNIPGPNYDIYVATPLAGTYVETAARLNIPDGTSLYGGYDSNWIRDLSPANRTPLNGDTQSVHFVDVNNEAWFSGFLLTVELPSGGVTVPTGVSADSGTATLYIQDNQIIGSNTATFSASTYGLRLAGLSGARILRNDISAGFAGNGETGVDGLDGNNGGNGSSTSSRTGGTREYPGSGL